MRPELESIDALIDAAKTYSGLTSDRKLGIALDISHNNVCRWKKYHYPSDEHQRRLAKLAGLPEEEALLALNAWRSSDPATKAIYTKLAERFQGAIFALLLAIGITTGTIESAEAVQENIGEQTAIFNVPYIHYARFFRRCVAFMQRFLAQHLDSSRHQHATVGGI